jgi:hypothetical protein
MVFSQPLFQRTLKEITLYAMRSTENSEMHLSRIYGMPPRIRGRRLMMPALCSLYAKWRLFSCFSWHTVSTSDHQIWHSSWYRLNSQILTLINDRTNFLYFQTETPKKCGSLVPSDRVLSRTEIWMKRSLSPSVTRSAFLNTPHRGRSFIDGRLS